jgi:lipopolysaccharide export system protein LptA
LRKIILSYKYRKALFLSAFLLFIHLSAHPQSKSIEFVHADRVTNAIVFPNASKAIGNVHFRHGNKDLFCDSAYFHQTNNWVKAYGHVQINQSDTLNLFCDSLHFDGNTNLGILKSNVRFRDNEFKLITDSLEFDATNSIGYYSNWATITSINQDLKLTSRKGYYYSKNKTFFFKDSVKVEDPSYSLTSDTLEFNTISQTVFFH